MKIGILGLRPRQINDIRGRGFNGDLYFHEDKAMSPASVSSFQRDKDLLFVQVHGMPKSAVQAVTTGENCYLNAGSSVSSLIRMIEGAFADLDQEAYRKNNSSPAPKSEPAAEIPDYTAKPKVESEPATMSKQKVVRGTLGDLLAGVLKEKDAYLGTEMPFGRTSEYVRQTEDLPLRVGMTDNQAFADLLRHASVGQVFRTTRPEGMEFSDWRLMLADMVKWMMFRHEAPVEVNLYTNYADVQLMTPFDTPLPSKPLAVSTPVTKPEPVVVAPVVEAEPAVVHLLEMIEPNVDGTHNYSVITTGVVGQVFRFRQPSKLTQPVWRQRIHSMRSYQKAKGFVVSVEFADGYVDVTVDKTPVQKAKPVVTEAVVDTPVVQAPVVEVAAEPEAETPVSTPTHSVDLEASETAKKFWCEAYLDATDRGESAEYAGLIADEAFEQYKLRFGS